MVCCRSNTHNAFRFAAGPLSGDISSRGAFTAMSQFLRYVRFPVKDDLFHPA